MYQTWFGVTLNNSTEVLEQTLDNDSMLQSQNDKIEVVGTTNELHSLWHKIEMKHDRNINHITNLVALCAILTPGGTMHAPKNKR